MSQNSETHGNSRPAGTGDLADPGSLNTGTPGEQGPPSVDEIRGTFGGPPAGDQTRETFAETLAAVAEAGRSLMRPTPLAEIGALRRHRRTRRTALTASLAAVATCAVAAGVTIAVSPGTTKAMPSVGAPPTGAGRSSTSPRLSSTPSIGTVPSTSATPGTATSPPPGPSSSIPDTVFVTAGQVPFPDGGPWQEGGEGIVPDYAVHDFCASAWDPVVITSKPGHPAPVARQLLYRPNNEAHDTPAMETVHVFASADDVALAYQKTKSLYAAQTCSLTSPSNPGNTRTIAPGGTIGAAGVQGFAVGGSDEHGGVPATGTEDAFRTYVVVKGNTIAVLMVPVTKDHATDSTQDKTTLTAIASRLP